MTNLRILVTIIVQSIAGNQGKNRHLLLLRYLDIRHYSVVNVIKTKTSLTM